MRSPLLSILAVLVCLLAATGCGPAAGDGSGDARRDAALTREAEAHLAMALDPPDWDAARAGFQAAARAGSPTARAYLGWMYEEGAGTDRDIHQAIYWYGQAAEAGALDYAVKVGWMYMSGEGVAQDRAKAESWFLTGIGADHSPARVALASLLIADALGGQEIERIPEARVLLEQSLEDGYTMASFFLARLYIEGIGGHPVDDDLAIHYTRIGAETGHAQMQGWLAFMYLNGRGVEVDRVTATMWANLAASGGDRMGNDIRLLLEENLEAEEVEEARRRAVAWALKHQ